MYEFDEQPGRAVVEEDFYPMRDHVLISQVLRQFGTVGLRIHGWKQHSEAVWDTQSSSREV
jgi:hypothetical protein